MGQVSHWYISLYKILTEAVSGVAASYATAVDCPHYRPIVRDLWIGVDGVCTFTIVMGIFVLFSV